jgi:hypothetical protein
VIEAVMDLIEIKSKSIGWMGLIVWKRREMHAIF